MQTDKNKAIDRIKKLIEHYNGCVKINSEQEAIVAMNLARKLMDEYHLDMMSIQSEMSEISHMATDKFSVYTVPLWECNLIKVINNICNCSCVLDKDKQPNGYIHMTVIFVAPKDDLEEVKSIYNLFKKTIRCLCNEHVKQVGGNTTNWRSFAEGFTSRLLEKSRCEQHANNTDDDFNDVEISDEVDEFCEDSETEEKESNSVQVNKKMDIEQYNKGIKIKINSYIYNTFQAKQEKIKSTTKVYIESFKCGQIAADKTNLPNLNQKG